ncbi:MAG: hydroxylase [Tepidiforma sp.]|nr:acyl-CoA dehydrogenase family protein [Tepidiforma sp.]GIW19701.1 MAG: hydroxylase [Tepidiforma sp.]
MHATVTATDLVAPVAEEIRRTAPQAEAERRLPPPLMAALKGAGLFSIYTPRTFGGLELALPEALAVVEEVSRHDGSTGWVVALGYANGYFTQALGPDAAARLFERGAALITAAPAFGVRAVAAEGGYRLTGRWSFNSGAPNADWVGAPAPVFEGDVPVTGPGGEPAVRFCFIPAADVRLIDTWHVTGLRATGTHDLAVDDLFVPTERTGAFSPMGGPQSQRPNALTLIPFFSLLGIVQAPPVLLGLARRFIEEFRGVLATKEGGMGQPLREQARGFESLARSEALVRSARCYWYDAVGELWERVSRGGAPTLEDRTNARLASLNVAEQCLAAAEALYRLAGTTPLFDTCPLERCWRDLRTTAQHFQVQPARWETAGRALMGLDPGSPVL